MNSPNRPFRRLVVLGDSNAYGMCASKPEHEWIQVAVRWLNDFQEERLEVYNHAIPSNVISPRCPAYELTSKPSLMERYHQHCIALNPDLVVIAQCLNDMRCGMPVQDYIADLEYIVSDIQRQSGALVVLMGMYYQVFGHGFNDPEEFPWATRWTPDDLDIYNLAISLLANRLGALFVDTFAVMRSARWLLHPDAVHMNDLGHVLVGNALFQVLATHCEVISWETLKGIEENQVSVANTGGALATAEVRQIWESHIQKRPDVLPK